MTAAMEVLFSHAQDWMVRPLLLAEPEYEDTLRHADSREQRLRAMLNEEETQLLDGLIDERNALFFFQEQALFRAGFQTALELFR